jgi:hypothetical protein
MRRRQRPLQISLPCTNVKDSLLPLARSLLSSTGWSMSFVNCALQSWCCGVVLVLKLDWTSQGVLIDSVANFAGKGEKSLAKWHLRKRGVNRKEWYVGCTQLRKESSGTVRNGVKPHMAVTVALPSFILLLVKGTVSSHATFPVLSED